LVGATAPSAEDIRRGAPKSVEDEELLLRLLTPLVKLFTAKVVVALASEGLECFGGQVRFSVVCAVGL